MVVADEVQESVGHEELQLRVERASAFNGLHGRERRAHRDIADDTLLGDLTRLSAAKLVHRKGQHIGGAGLVHPLDMKVGHALLVDERDRELAIGVEPEPVEEEHGKAIERAGIARNVGLVRDRDERMGHCARSAS